MTKVRTKFVCQQCGAEAAKWMGRCTECREWNSLVEIRETGAALPQPMGGGINQPIALPAINMIGCHRISTGLGEVDRVLGGGIVAGSLVLIGGDPGIGKSTLMLQVSGCVAASGGMVLYISGEESAEQIKMRSQRLGIENDQLYVYPEIELDLISTAITGVKPNLVIIDSIQTIYSNQLSAAPGSVSQVRDCTLKLMHLAKSTQIPIFIVGHVTKEGTVAGPRVLEHIVDAVLYLEGERFQTYRLLRGVKNRFGSTNEVGVFEMKGEGLAEVPNPSAAFLADRGAATSGSTIVVSLEGTRPLLVEVQALVTTTNFGLPRCTTNGIEYNRLLMLLAVLTKRVGLALANQDVYINVVSGMELNEPAADLGVALAIASSFREQVIPGDVACIGEIGLSGELRPVHQADKRLREAAKLGFRYCLLPKPTAQSVGNQNEITVVPAGSLTEALDFAFRRS